jgi:hypothetical protein
LQLVPRRVWELLHGWYGGGPPLARFVIEEGDAKVIADEDCFVVCLFVCYV